MAKSKKIKKTDIQVTAMSPAPVSPSLAEQSAKSTTKKKGPKIPKGPVIEKHTCMGLNSCENRGYSGKNACAGQGDCATITHSCHTLNECKGQGGCGLFGTTPEFCHPGENDCKFQGSCGSPIIASRFIVDGPNKGLSVWQLAHKRFEERMQKQRRKVGPVPAGQEYGPTIEFVKARGMGSSCGQSGSRYCSYALKDNAEKKYDRRETFMKKSSDSTYSSEGCSES